MNIEIKSVLENNYFNKRYWLIVEGFDFEILFERVCANDSWDGNRDVDLDYFRCIVSCKKLNKLKKLDVWFSEDLLNDDIMIQLKTAIYKSM